jgi:hypothetical protein
VRGVWIWVGVDVGGGGYGGLYLFRDRLIGC